MKKAIILDLDGTLLDSYDVIVESICLVFQECGIHISYNDVHRHAIAFSIKSLFETISDTHGVSVARLQQRYSQISSGKYKQIKLMPHAHEILNILEDHGIENYVFTHRGKTTMPVLDNLELTGYFLDVLTSQSGFARKPDPEAILYLLHKYDLDPENTWYVGDRSLDMECASYAGIRGILYLPEGCIDVSGGAESVVVHDLLQIADLI